MTPNRSSARRPGGPSNASPSGPAEEAMSGQKRIGNWATAWLVIALALAVAGLTLQRSGISPFLGGLVSAFGEAALIGGLADWFARPAPFRPPPGLRPLSPPALIPP